MANEAEVFGLPQILISFRTKGTTAIKRSARGIVAMILKESGLEDMASYKISDVTDVPSTLSSENIDLIKKCLLGTPLRILLYVIPAEEGGEDAVTQDTALKALASLKWNYICAPAATTKEQEDLASWVKAQRNNKRKTFKAVCANQAADHEGVINFCTGDIKVITDTNLLGNPVYTTYTAVQYTARIAGILAGLALDRSATYFKLTEVESVEKYEDIDSLIDKGQLLLFDELDGEGVKIARACNSLVSFTTDKGEDFRKIKIMEGVDMVTDDIRDTFKKYYVGKIINDYDHKMLFVAAILVYFSEIAGNVLDINAGNTVDINEEAQRNYAILKGENVEDMTAMQIRQYNTGSKVFLAGKVKFVDAMEDLKLDFTM